ncbi:3-hydroxyisobutyrate dehydrogenase [Rhizobium sp. RU35A]|uniref:3-hydroxyisobutyrate dehydrogenase n=1 Tax=Rhizobium sp. RU35A TaxID=1907414 RepID=UPI00095658CF|nr:3-hydroxyisobutyrate dehydrogenase [Rhizobium sp. RU35A]SIQ33165.1 3-hydroxyisobutyrate dehydrogenase [Rhizobium sp. RU35A]
MASIAFIGLGNMGLPMAANLLKAGHAVKGFDLSSSARDAASDAGLELAADLLDAIRAAEVIITMLPAGVHVVTVWTDIAGKARPGSLVIDCSTIDVESARKAHAIAESAGLASLDAPVSGGTGGASAGSLTFMVGGTGDTFARALPLLEAMGRKIVHCGATGAGQAAKICNNMILGISMIAVCEAFALGEKLGLSHQALYDVASTSSGQCWSLTSYCPVPGPVPTSPANRDYVPGFAAGLMLKDLKLAQQAALATGAATPLGAEAAQLYGLFNKAGQGGRDFSAIIEMLRGAG